MSPEVLRAELHRMADWVADYRESVGDRPILSAVAPGDVTAGLESSVPNEPASMATIRRDFDAVDAGNRALGSSGVSRLLRQHE